MVKNKLTKGITQDEKRRNYREIVKTNPKKFIYLDFDQDDKVIKTRKLWQKLDITSHESHNFIDESFELHSKEEIKTNNVQSQVKDRHEQ